MSKHIDVDQFEAQHPNIQLIESLGEGEWKIELYLDQDTVNYYAKGPFARWDAICYVYLSKLKSSEDVPGWLEQMKKNM